MKRKVGLIILNCAAKAVLMGACYDMFAPAVPADLMDYLGITIAPQSSRPPLTYRSGEIPPGFASPSVAGSVGSDSCPAAQPV